MIHLDGFGQFFGAPAVSALNSAGYDAAGTISVVTGPESDTHALQWQTLAGAQPNTVSRTFHSLADRVVIGFAWYGTSRGRVVSVDDLLTVDWSESLSMLGVSGTALPVTSLWHYVDLEIDRATGVVNLWHNNRLDVTAPLPPAGEGMQAFTVRWGHATDEPGQARLSGLYAAGHRLGPIAISTDMPIADVAVAWAPASGASHYAMVNGRPPDDARYIQTAEPGLVDLFAFAQPSEPLQQPILAVGLCVRAHKTDLDPRQLGIVVGQGTQQLQVSVSDLTTTPRTHYAIYEQSPAGQPWTEADLAFEPAGVKLLA